MTAPPRRGWLVPPRRDAPELMDAPGLPEVEVAEAHETLRRVNHQLGNNRSIDREADRFFAEDRPASPLSILDVGAGSGDLTRRLSRRLARRSRGAVVTLSLDRDPVAARLAARDDAVGRPYSVRGDALRLPLADRSVDLVTAVKFAHHFEGRSLHRLLGEMARVARRRVVVLDIRRHWAAYWGFVAWSRAFTGNRLVRHDGPLSVLRGFTARELIEATIPFAAFDWTVRHYVGFQLALVGRRKDLA